MEKELIHKEFNPTYIEIESTLCGEKPSFIEPTLEKKDKSGIPVWVKRALEASMLYSDYTEEGEAPSKRVVFTVETWVNTSLDTETNEPFVLERWTGKMDAAKWFGWYDGCTPQDVDFPDDPTWQDLDIERVI